MKIPVEVMGLFSDPASESSIVILGETNKVTRVLPIFIGKGVAQSIAVGLSGTEPPRPLTHDLIVDLLKIAGASLETVLVTALKDGVFLAEIGVRANDKLTTLSVRPSDAIALAVRLGIQLAVEPSVLDAAGVEVLRHPSDQPFSEDEIDNIVDEFQSFLESAQPEDFASATAEPDPENEEARPPSEEGEQGL